jgi:hypothetical protein
MMQWSASSAISGDFADTSIRVCSAGPYFDDDGPCLADAFVMFLDLLGTAGIRSGDESRAHLSAVRSAVQEARVTTFTNDSSDPTVRSTRWFSDNLCVAYPVGTDRATSRLVEMVLEAAYLQLAFLRFGLPARGAIARGEFFADPTFIYGAALDRAYRLESTRSVFPRCVLDEASVATAYDGLVAEDGGARGSAWRRYLMVDPEGVVFVDYLGIAAEDPAGHGLVLDEVLTAHADLIRTMLARYDGVVAVESKYRWLAAYHNYIVSGGLPERHKIGAGHRVQSPRADVRMGPFGSELT